jgi:hypothetical protein
MMLRKAGVKFNLNLNLLKYLRRSIDPKKVSNYANMNTRIINYFNHLADKIEADSKLSRGAQNRSDIGYNREKIIELFLSRHLPKRLTAYQGGIFSELMMLSQNKLI